MKPKAKGANAAGLPTFEQLGAAMRPERFDQGEERDPRKQAFRLSREERDYVASHALDSIGTCAKTLIEVVKPGNELYAGQTGGSDNARKIAALSNLLGGIGWERSEARPLGEGYYLGAGLFPVAQLRPWLEQWTEEDPLVSRNTATDEAFAKLGTGVMLLDRLEKWMASHGD